MRVRLPDVGPHRDTLLVLTAQVFIIMLGLGLATPILPLYAQSFGLSAAAVGSLITVFGVARILINIPAGHWTERFGRRKLLIFGPVITAAGSFGFAFATSFAQLLLWRVLQGVGSAVLTTAAMVVLADLSGPGNRGRIMSLYQGSLLLGAGAGPALGGVIAGAWGFRAPFFMFGAFTLLAGVWAFFRIPETRDLAAAREPARRDAAGRANGAAAPPSLLPASMWTMLRDVSFLLVSLVTLATFFTRSGGQMTLLPLLGHNELGLSETAIGMVFTVISLVNFATLYVAGSLSDRFGRKVVIVPSGVLTAIAIGLYVYAGTGATFLAVSILLGIGTGLGGPAPAAYVADIVPAGMVGPAMGLYRTISDLGLVLGPVLLGSIVDTWGYDPAFAVNAVLMLVSTLLFAALARETTGKNRRV
ncbi:MAG: MFS transporter [Thermoanaerobaculia bacterium]